MAAFALVLAACGPVTPAGSHDDHLQLTLKLKAGETLRYQLQDNTQLTGTSSGLGSSTHTTTNTKVSMTESLHVNSVDSAGTADVTIKIDKFSMTGGVNPTAGMPPIHLRIYSDGRVAAIGPAGQQCTLPNGLSSLFNGEGPNSDSVLLPPHSVKPGDSWETKITAPFPGNPEQTILVRSTLLRFESLDGVRNAVVKTSTSFPLNFTMDVSRPPAGCAFMGPAGAGPPQGNYKPPAGMTPPAGAVPPGASAPPPGFSQQPPHLSMSGTVSAVGTVWFDIQDHWLSKENSSSTGDITTTVKISSPAQAPGQPPMPDFAMTSHLHVVSTNQLTKLS